MINNLSIKTFLQDIGAGANYLGLEAYLVGGFVRNALYAELENKTMPEIKDIDIVITGDAIDFCYKFQKFVEDNDDHHETFDIVEEFKQFKTIKIHHPKYPDYVIEFASTRKEIYHQPADFPKVEIIDNVQEDLARRDFSINALLISLNKTDFAELIDYVGGIADMQNKVIRAFHSDSFIDDPTRIYRAERFAKEYNFVIEPQTLEWIEKAKSHVDFEKWLAKRKNRVEIEIRKIP